MGLGERVSNWSSGIYILYFMYLTGKMVWILPYFYFQINGLMMVVVEAVVVAVVP